jgi:pimeloyl-ACP methyl ester carboxylesterase
VPASARQGDAPRELSVEVADGVTLAGELSGPWPPPGPPIVLLHGLTSTRRYVVMGSRSLERSGHAVIAYDARGHGRSTGPGRPELYDYRRLAGDLGRVLDHLGVERALVAGVSMGAHTALRLALEDPGRVAGLGLITPAFEPSRYLEPARIAAWDALARGLREDGVDGFIAAYDLAAVAESWRGPVELAIRQRMAEHEHPEAVADALEGVPRSAAFADVDQLSGIAVPTVVVASRDEPDPGHPLAVAELYARSIQGAQLLVEPPGPPPSSPIAWRGGLVARLLADLAARAA